MSKASDFYLVARRNGYALLRKRRGNDADADENAFCLLNEARKMECLMWDGDRGPQQFVNFATASQAFLAASEKVAEAA